MNMHNISVKFGLFSTLIISVVLFYTVDGICTSLGSPSSCLKWSKCRRSDSNETLTGLSPLQCVEQCRLRPKCKAINYWRRKRSCDIIYELDNWESLIPPTYGPCVRIYQNNSIPATCFGCNRRTTCTAHEGTCTIEACSPLHVLNTTIYGNIYSVGSMAKVVYLENPTMSVKQICQPNGLWAPILNITSDGNNASSNYIIIYDTLVTQGEATQTCEAANQSLIKMNSLEKFDAAQQFVKSMPRYDSLQYWIQGRHVNGEWQYDDGSILLHNILPFNDMDGGGSGCVRLVGNKINDVSCSSIYGFICETTTL